MNTHDFSASHSNFGNDARRAEQLRLASAIDLDTIRVALTQPAPIGSHGFRTGTWTATVAGETIRFFSSVPHGMELDVQHARLVLDAALHVAGLRSGYIVA